MRIQRHVRVIYYTDQCGYRDTFGLYTTRCSLLRHTKELVLQINADTETRSGYILYTNRISSSTD